MPRLLAILLLGTFLFSACTHEYSYERGPSSTNPPPDPNIFTSFFVEMNYNGTRTRYDAGKENFETYFERIPFGGPDIATGGIRNMQGRAKFEFQKSHLTFTSDDSTHALRIKRVMEFFKPGASTFSIPLLQSGVGLTWTEPNGTIWRTGMIVLENDGQHFTITESKATDPGATIIGVEFKANFRANFYNENGAVREIEGKMWLEIWV